MRLIVHMPVRNEADRYLQSCLAWANRFADGIHVFDDNSTDETADIARDAGAIVSRNTTAASFTEHEGQFRQAAWNAFEDHWSPTEDDWILALDADEFLVGASTRLRDDIEKEVVLALALRVTAIMLPIPEVFDPAVPQVRLDGFWGTISGLRLFRYQPDGQFNDRIMGCGSAPSYVMTARQRRSTVLSLLHYGYAHPADRNDKYARYTATPHGHADRHIASIPARPVLRDWNGPTANVWRGQRQVAT